jgi:multidrug efflux pump subunit AcrB
VQSLVKFFISRHLLSNSIFIGLILIALFSWDKVGKEEMPDFTMDWIRISTSYPGAPAEDVELFVTRPIEEELKGVAGIEDISSTSTLGSSSLRIYLDTDYPDKKQVIQDVKDAALRANLPSEVRDIPSFRQFKSTEKAIIDIALIHKKNKYLDNESRAELQKYALTFENQILSLPEISSISKSGYLEPELQILLLPEKLSSLELSISEIYGQINDNHIRVPIGSLKDPGESKITAINELDSVQALDKLILRGTYTGPMIALSQISHIKSGFRSSARINKVQGREAVILNVKKSVSTDILSAKKAVMKFVERFRKTNADSDLSVVLMDDESFDVTNRLSIIYSNGLIGFIFILIVLFIFLDFKSGFWVAMGVPFSLAFTLILTHLVGYTVNNMTLAGIIIVMGIVVDDAIIIAENITRHKKEGKAPIQASIDGTLEVIHPILASMITTCVAFIPLLYFEGHFGKFVSYIPLMVVLMLAGSLLESIFILPSHMSQNLPFIQNKQIKKTDWFTNVENLYERFLGKAISMKWIVFLAFFSFLSICGYLFKSNMKFVMFPREETKEVFIKAIVSGSPSRIDTAKKLEEIENIFLEDKTNSVVAVRTRVGQNRRGGEVKDNEGWIRVELIPADKREVDLKTLIKGWEEKTKNFTGYKKIKIFKSWFGRGSRSAIEIIVQENDNTARNDILQKVKNHLESISSLDGVELEKPLDKKEYLFKINQKKLVLYNIDPKKVARALRIFVEGSILYTINKGDEEVDVRLTVPDAAKVNLKALLNLKVENKSGRLLRLNKFISIIETNRPSSISRLNFKRTAKVFANLSKSPTLTPLEIGSNLETNLFPQIYKDYPSSILSFSGEIEDSRNSKSEFKSSLVLIVVLIYFVLLVMFNSLTTPLIVLSIIPFGLASASLVFILHGINIYGFFAVIGALGMIGVVINDSIVMLDKLEKGKSGGDWSKYISSICSTRLRPVLVTTITTIVAILPTAYGIAGYDSMLAEMMLTMGWGLLFSTVITLILVPCLYSFKNPK